MTVPREFCGGPRPNKATAIASGSVVSRSSVRKILFTVTSKLTCANHGSVVTKLQPSTVAFRQSERLAIQYQDIGFLTRTRKRDH